MQPEHLLIHLTAERYADEALRFPLTPAGQPPRVHSEHITLSAAETIERIEDFLASFGTWEEIRRRPRR